MRPFLRISKFCSPDAGELFGGGMLLQDAAGSRHSPAARLQGGQDELQMREQFPNVVAQAQASGSMTAQRSLREL
jgi:hypothetical protein